MMKTRLQKLEGSTYNKLNKNIKKVVKDIPKEIYENIMKGTHERIVKYVKKKISNRLKTLKNYK